MHDDDLCGDLTVSTNAHVAGNGSLRLRNVFCKKASYQHVIGCFAKMISRHSC